MVVPNRLRAVGFLHARVPRDRISEPPTGPFFCTGIERGTWTVNLPPVRIFGWRND
jgi:hypothetical protein